MSTNDSSKEQAAAFTPEEIVQMLKITLKKFGGDAAIRDWGQLESASREPFLDIFGVEICPSIMDKAAKYAMAFDLRQVFTDGNKRVSLSVMLGWLAKNGYKCTLSNFALHELMIDLSMHLISDEDLPSILERHTEPTSEFANMSLDELMKVLLKTYEDAYRMLGAGALDPAIDEWKADMRAHGDEGNYRD